MRKRYDPATPRLALRLIAVAMTVATMALMVVLPAQLETVSIDSTMLAVSSAVHTQLARAPQ